MHFRGGRPLAEYVELIAGPTLGRAGPGQARAGLAWPGLGPGQTDTVSLWLFFETVILHWGHRITNIAGYF